MTINGYLSEFSPGEIFQLIENGEKTGLLSIRTLVREGNPNHRKYYIWFRQGRVIAAANQLNQTGLLSLIQKRGWVKDSISSKLSRFCKIDSPLGSCLKSIGALDSDQLKWLFITQIMQQICALFKLDQGFFEFKPNVKPPAAEMTGLNKAPTELTLLGLRLLRNWTPLAEKLPEPSSGLISLIRTKPTYTLSSTEWQVWEYTNGTTALKTIAKALQIPIEKVQQIAFRLIVVGLAEELPLVEILPPEKETQQPQPKTEIDPSAVNSFLDSLTSFVQARIAKDESEFRKNLLELTNPPTD